MLRDEDFIFRPTYQTFLPPQGKMLRDEDFMFVPTYQLKRNTQDTLEQILKFINVKDQAFQFDTKTRFHVAEERVVY
jgi:hypothetical protein